MSQNIKKYMNRSIKEKFNQPADKNAQYEIRFNNFWLSKISYRILFKYTKNKFLSFNRPYFKEAFPFFFGLFFLLKFCIT